MNSNAQTKIDVIGWVIVATMLLVALALMAGCRPYQPDGQPWRTLDYGGFGVLRVHEPTGTCVLFHGNATVLSKDVCASYK